MAYDTTDRDRAQLVDAIRELEDENARLLLMLRDVVSHQPDCATDRHGGCADWCPVRHAANYLPGAIGEKEE